jgi:hypothetical protein
MGKKLAIRGHSMRGKEVIKLLEMMGGKNIREHKYDGSANMYSYYINNGIILNDRLSIIEDDDFIIFTLEEFLEKYPFYNGDKVFDIADGEPGIISAMKWDEDVSDMKYLVWFDNGDIGWYTNDTIGFLKKDGFLEYKIVDGYEVDKIENGKIILKPIKPKYPTTYDECCDILNANEFVEYELMTNFPKLINARNAYWKIAGEELGLGKPWEPDWNSLDKKHNIYNYRGVITLNFTVIDRCILVFPTEEMRDAFYENFKDLIEQCKELL